MQDPDIPPQEEGSTNGAVGGVRPDEVAEAGPMGRDAPGASGHLYRSHGSQLPRQR